MTVHATATASNGAVLDLAMAVFKSRRWDLTVESEDMTAACSGVLDRHIYGDNFWSFARIAVTAVQRPGPTWPTSKRITIEPLPSYLRIASNGFLQDDDTVLSTVPDCEREKFIDGAGKGNLIVGFAGDSDEVGSAGGYTKWANHNWGFLGIYFDGQTAAKAGVSLSDCSHLVTDLGTEFNGDAGWWTARADDTQCIFGSPQEDQDY